MGDPYFKVKDLCKRNNVAVFSSNFSLYTNMSDRVMMTLSEFTPELEVYSVDEAFLNLTGFQNLESYAREIKKMVEMKTGIPVGVGVGPTKTLAKIANHIAKKSQKAGGVVVLLDRKLQDEALRRVSVEDIWGVGRANSHKLKQMGIHTAKEFRDYKNDRHIQKVFTKIGLQIKEELMGQSRFDLELTSPKKKEIISSRTFGSSVEGVEHLRESVANYASAACEKLRKQSSVCSGVEVYIRTSPFKNTEQYYAIETAKILSATSDTRKVIRYALGVLDKLFRAGYEYKKAGIKLTQITDRTQSQMSLMDSPDSLKTDALMRCMDEINGKEGPRTLFSAACGTQNKAWAMNRNYKSPRYVSSWNELPVVK